MRPECGKWQICESFNSHHRLQSWKTFFPSSCNLTCVGGNGEHEVGVGGRFVALQPQKITENDSFAVVVDELSGCCVLSTAFLMKFKLKTVNEPLTPAKQACDQAVTTCGSGGCDHNSSVQHNDK